MTLYHSIYDIYFLILVLPALVVTLLCEWNVSRSVKRYSRVPSRSGATGAETAERICRYGEARYTQILPTSGHLTDHYDPKSNCIRLSENVYDQSSIAAVSIAAHEAGHAAQYAQGYTPARLRMSIIPATQVASNMAMPLVLLGLITSFGILVNIGIGLFGVALLFQLLTLPVEFNASRRALQALESTGVLQPDELPQARRVLTAAALTYVAAMAVSLVQLIRLLLLAGRRRGGRR